MSAAPAECGAQRSAHGEAAQSGRLTRPKPSAPRRTIPCVARHPDTPGPGRSPRGLQAATTPAWPRSLREQPRRPGFPAPTLPPWLRQDARRGPPGGGVPTARSLTHLRRRRPPAPPAPAPRPRAAALASRPPAATLRLGCARPPHAEQQSPGPLFPQLEGRGGEGTPWVGRNGAGRGLALPPRGPFSGL